MPYVLYHRRRGRRELLSYVWERPSYLVYVDPADFLEVITHRGFELVDADDLTRIDGITPALQEEFHLVGITRFEELIGLAEAIGPQLCQSLRVSPEDLAQWRQEAVSLTNRQ